MDEPLPLRVGQLVADRYRVESVVGQGGMGVVYAARHIGHGGKVALKVLRAVPGTGGAKNNAKRALRLRREAKVVARLRGEHVARVLDVGALPGGEPFVALELLRGRDLASTLDLAPQHRLAIDTVIRVAFELCEALAEAHAAGVIHRDIKPSNLFLANTPGHDSQLKVLDFGIAKAKVVEEEFSTLTADDVAMGSTPYMAPEQIRDARDVDARADIWSLGVVLYECLSGRRPFVGSSDAATLAAIISDTPTPLKEIRSDVSDELAALIDRCLQKNTEARWQDILQLAAGLRGIEGVAAEGALARVYRAHDLGESAGDDREHLGLESERTLDPFSGENASVVEPREGTLDPLSAESTTGRWDGEEEKVERSATQPAGLDPTTLAVQRRRAVVIGVAGVAVLSVLGLGVTRIRPAESRSASVATWGQPPAEVDPSSAPNHRAPGLVVAPSIDEPAVDVSPHGETPQQPAPPLSQSVSILVAPPASVSVMLPRLVTQRSTAMTPAKTTPPMSSADRSW